MSSQRQEKDQDLSVLNHDNLSFYFPFANFTDVIKQEKGPVNQITGQHDPVTEDLFLNHPSSTSSTTSTTSNHPLPSLLLNSRSRSRSPTNNPHQPLQISSNTQLQDGIPISPPSTPPSSPTPSIAALPSSPSASLIQTNSSNNNFNPNVNVMVRSSGGRMVDHNSGPASESDSSNAESQSEISAEGSGSGSGSGIIDNGYGNQEDWESYQEVGFKGKGKAKGKEQCAVDLLSATVSKMATSPPPSNNHSTKSTSSHQQAQSHEKVSAVKAEEKLQDEVAENEEGEEEEEDAFTEDEESEPSNQLSHHQQLLSFSRPITMPDTPAATPESFQYPSTSRGSSATSTNSSLPSGPELGVSHRPTFSARAFMVELFPSLEDKLLSAKSVVNSKSKSRKNRSLKEGWLAEDAGVELIENCFGWRGAVLDRNGAVMRKTGRGTPEKRVLYVSMPLGDNNNNRISGGQEPNPTSTSNHLYQSQASLRTTVLSLLDFASDSLHPPCGALVLSIEKDLLAQGELPSLLHGLCYVGGNVVSFNGEKEESAEEGGAGEKPREGVVLVRIEL